MERAMADLLQGAREAILQLNDYFDRTTNDAHKRRILQTILKLERSVSELSDRFEPI